MVLLISTWLASFQILVQTFVGLILTCYGVVHMKLGALKEIRANADTEHK